MSDTVLQGVETAETENKQGVETANTENKQGENIDIDSVVADKAQKMADAIVAKKLKGMPTKEEVQEYRQWRESQQTDEEKINNIITERDGFKSELENINKENENLKNELYLIKKNVPIADVDYHLFKISKLVSNEKNFEQAAEEYLKENKISKPEDKVTGKVDFGAEHKGSHENKSATMQLTEAMVAAWKR